MATEFADIRIVKLDEEHTTRADPTQALYEVHFVLSTKAPAGWCRILQAHLGLPGVAGRRAWLNGNYVIVRCTIDEVEAVLAALRPMVEAANQEYRDLSAAGDRARLEGEALDQKERQKLRDLNARLGFD
jgi:hypothetical protein